MYYIYFVLKRIFYYFIIYYILFTATTDFQRYVVRKLLDIDFKISTVHEEEKNINTKLDSIQNQIQTFVLDDGVKNKDVEVDYMEFFPLQTLEELEKFEQQSVENKINRKALVCVF